VVEEVVVEGVGGVVLGEEHGTWAEAEGVFAAPRVRQLRVRFVYG